MRTNDKPLTSHCCPPVVKRNTCANQLLALHWSKHQCWKQRKKEEGWGDFKSTWELLCWLLRSYRTRCLLEKRKRWRAAPLWVRRRCFGELERHSAPFHLKHTRTQLVRTHANTHMHAHTHTLSLHTTIRRKMMTRVSRDAVGSSAISSCQVTPSAQMSVCDTAP